MSVGIRVAIFYLVVEFLIQNVRLINTGTYNISTCQQFVDVLYALWPSFSNQPLWVHGLFGVGCNLGSWLVETAGCDYRVRSAITYLSRLNHFLESQRAVPRALTLLGGARFIAWQILGVRKKSGKLHERKRKHNIPSINKSIWKNQENTRLWLGDNCLLKVATLSFHYSLKTLP